jgi:iron complex outermembrane receptor protein
MRRCSDLRHRVAFLVAIIAPGAALAQSASDKDSILEEVIVTAQHRQQNLQETPLAVSVVDAASIKQRNVVQLADIAKSVPNATFDTDSGSGKTAQIFIRGIGQFDYQYVVEPGVGVYVDDVYHSTQFGTQFDLLDLERVEVLRGPQGTLFGKNSIGGAVRLISTKPQGDGSAMLELTAGNLDRHEIRGMFDVPLIDKTLLLRVAAQWREKDGYVDQFDFACVQPDLGGIVNPGAPELPTPQRPPGDCKLGSFGNERVKSARAALRWIPSNVVTVDLVGDRTDDDSNAAAQTIIGVNTDASDPFNPLGGFNANVAIPIYGIPYDQRFLTGNFYRTYANLQNLVHVGPGPNFPEAAITAVTSAPNSNTLRAYGFAGTVTWNITSALQLTSITGYRDYTGTFSDDVDASPLNQTFQQNDLDHHQFSEEIRLHGSSFTARLDWTAGLFYFDAFNRNRGPVILSAVTWFAPSLDFTQDDTSNATNKAAFLDATWHVNDRLNLTAGIRYTREDKDYTFRHLSFVPGVPDLIPPTRTDVSYSRNNPRAVIDYRWAPSLMIYASYATGFRAGGFNGRPFNPTQVVAFEPETLDSYEVGIKSEWLDRRLRINVAAFSGDYEDIQVTIATVDPTGQSYFAPVNLGRARITGGEIELEAEPIAGLTLAVSYGRNRFDVTELGAAFN